jgi:hypothetical protein
MQRRRVGVKGVRVKPNHAVGAGRVGALTAPAPRPRLVKAIGCLLEYRAMFQRSSPYVPLITISWR